jgi:hypothetical protein
MRVIPAWRKNVLRLLNNGRTLTETCALTGVGKSKINLERKKDSKFDEEMESALSKSSSKRNVLWS